jgi:hypothetical protein
VDAGPAGVLVRCSWTGLGRGVHHLAKVQLAVRWTLGPQGTTGVRGARGAGACHNHAGTTWEEISVQGAAQVEGGEVIVRMMVSIKARRSPK